MSIRPYRNETDFDAVRRLWEEIAWLDRDEDDHVEGLKHFLGSSENLVAEMNGEAECLVARCAGTIRHLDSDLSMCVIAAVTTSLIARKQGFASRLTAKAIAEGAEAGMATAALGMFDQGYYTRLGFGNGSYEHIVRFNPANLTIDVDCDVPVRLTNSPLTVLLSTWTVAVSTTVLVTTPIASDMMRASINFRPSRRDSERGLFTSDELDAFRAEWTARSEARASYCYTPTMADAILRKR